MTQIKAGEAVIGGWPIQAIEDLDKFAYSIYGEPGCAATVEVVADFLRVYGNAAWLMQAALAALAEA